MNKIQPTQSSSIWLWSSLDTAIATAATLLCLMAVYAGPQEISFSTVLSERLSIKNFLLLTLFLVFWTGIHQLSGLYRNVLQMSWRSLVLRAAISTSLGSIFFLLFPLFSHQREMPLFTPVLIFSVSAFFASFTVRSALWQLLPRLAAQLQGRALRILIIGSGPIAGRLFQSLAEGPKTSVAGFVDSPGAHTMPEGVRPVHLGGFEQLERVLMSTAVDEVLIALPLRSCYDQIQTSIKSCERAGVPVSYHFHPFSHTLGFSQVRQGDLEQYVSWRPSRIEQSSAAKRIVDVIGAVFALLLFSPLLLATALAIKLTSRGPVLFTQERYGLNKQRFRMFKFRTMVPDAEARQAALESQNEAQGPVFKIKNDPRVTPIGRFLRRTSLDELPQFLNVLKGDMSLVGPRPLPLRDVARFSDTWLMRRFSVKPGLTCLWQVQGRSGTTFDQWIAYDLEYIANWSPLLDCKILLMTIPAVLRGSGAM